MKKALVCLLIQAHTEHSGVLSPPFFKSWSCAAVHQLATVSLPPTSMLRPFLSSANVILLVWEGAAILDSLKETGKKSYLALTSLRQYWSPCTSTHMIFLSSVEFKLNIYHRHNAVTEEKSKE